MFSHEFSGQQLATLKASAAIMNGIVNNGADELPPNVIRQWEIACLYHTYGIQQMILLAFKQRVEAGATIEPGPYKLMLDADRGLDVFEESAGLMNFGGDGYDVLYEAAPDAEKAAA